MEERAGMGIRRVPHVRYFEHISNHCASANSDEFIFVVSFYWVPLWFNGMRYTIPIPRALYKTASATDN